jgi:Na+/proline symporter
MQWQSRSKLSILLIEYEFSTGMHIIAATFLLPVGVIVYTFVGGIKATFLTDYFHTFVITVIICFFTIKTFTVPL